MCLVIRVSSSVMSASASVQAPSGHQGQRFLNILTCLGLPTLAVCCAALSVPIKRGNLKQYRMNCTCSNGPGRGLAANTDLLRPPQALAQQCTVSTSCAHAVQARTNMCVCYADMQAAAKGQSILTCLGHPTLAVRCAALLRVLPARGPSCRMAAGLGTAGSRSSQTRTGQLCGCTARDGTPRAPCTCREGVKAQYSMRLCETSTRQPAHHEW
jgi:hypothetical protein